MAARLSDGDDRLANEAGPEQRRLPEVPCRAHLVQVHANQVRGEHADDLLDLKRREPERLRISDGGRERGSTPSMSIVRYTLSRLMAFTARSTDAPIPLSWTSNTLT